MAVEFIDASEAPKASKAVTSKQKNADELAAQLVANAGKVAKIKLEEGVTARAMRVGLFHAVVTRGGVDKDLFQSWETPSADGFVFATVKVPAKAEATEAKAEKEPAGAR